MGGLKGWRIIPVICLLLPSLSSFGSTFDTRLALDRSQSVIGNVIDDVMLLDTTGEVFSLSELSSGPILVQPVYTSCHYSCPLTTRQLDKAVSVARDALGEDSFSVLTVGFDSTRDTPGRMAAFASERGIDEHRWVFASGFKGSMQRLLDDLGFSFIAAAGGFEHLSQITVLDSDRRVYRQIYGDAVDPMTITEPLKDLVWKRSADGQSWDQWVEGVRLFCTVFDPASGRYRFNYSIFAAILAAVLSLGATALFVIRAWRQSSRHRLTG